MTLLSLAGISLQFLCCNLPIAFMHSPAAECSDNFYAASWPARISSHVIRLPLVPSIMPTRLEGKSKGKERSLGSNNRFAKTSEQVSVESSWDWWVSTSPKALLWTRLSAKTQLELTWAACRRPVQWRHATPILQNLEPNVDNRRHRVWQTLHLPRHLQTNPSLEHTRWAVLYTTVRRRTVTRRWTCNHFGLFRGTFKKR